MATKTLTGNPIVVGSGDSFTATTEKVRIQGFFWEIVGAVAAGDTVKVTDTAGNILWEATVPTGALSSSFSLTSIRLLANGMQITSPTRGTLFVYLLDSLI